MKFEKAMEQCSELLRQHINTGASLEQLLVDWAFFLHKNVIVKHCELLLGLNALQNIESAYEKKAPIMLRYFRTKQTELRLSEFLSQLEHEKANDNLQAILQGIIVCLQKCLGEEEKSLMFHIDVST